MNYWETDPAYRTMTLICQHLSDIASAAKRPNYPYHICTTCYNAHQKNYATCAKCINENCSEYKTQS